MRETPLYQGTQVQAPERPHVEQADIRLPENPAPQAVEQAIRVVQGALSEYAELKDYQKKLDAARKRKTNEVDFRMEMKRRAELPWGSEGSLYHADGTQNEEVIAGLVTQYQERNLATRADYWLRKNNVQEEQGLLMENEQLRLDALEMLGNQERQNIERSFRDTFQMMIDTGEFDGAYAVASGAVMRGIITPQKAESLKILVDERKHENKQRNLMDKANGMLADGAHDELILSYLNGDFDELDADKKLQIQRIIDGEVGRVRHKAITDSSGRTKVVAEAPHGLPDYMTANFNRMQQMGGELPLAERQRAQEDFVRWAQEYITDPDNAAQLETVRRVGKDFKYSEKFVTQAIEASLQEFGGTAKFHVSDYVRLYEESHTPLLNKSQRLELEQARQDIVELQAAMEDGELDDDDKTRLQRAKFVVSTLEMQRKQNMGRLQAAVSLAMIELDNRNKDARYAERVTMANHASYRVLSEITGNKNPASEIAPLKEWQRVSAQAREREGAESTARSADAKSTTGQTKKQADAQKVESFSMPQSRDAVGSAGFKKPLLYVPRGSELAGRTIAVSHPTAKGTWTVQVQAVEADVQTPALSFRAHCNLRNGRQISRMLIMQGDKAVLTEGDEEGDESTEEATPVSTVQSDGVTYTTDDGLLPDEGIEGGETWDAPEGELGF